MTRRAALSRQLERAARLLDLVVRNGPIDTLRSRRPFSIAAARLTTGVADAGIAVGTLIDGGANAGQFSAAVLHRWPDAHVIAFEPLAGPAERLRSALRDAQAEIYEVALASSDGSLKFYPHEFTLSSSALPTTAASADESWGKELDPIEVQSRRLDSVLAGRVLRSPVLLKLDVQGYELEVLRGAEQVLAQVDYALIEMAFDRTYDGQPLFGEVHDFLEQGGWELVRPLDSRVVEGRTVEADFLYQRRGEESS